MKQQSDRNKCAGFLYNDVIREFKKIMELSEQNMKLDKESDEQCKQWLDGRKKLDSRMEPYLIFDIFVIRKYSRQVHAMIINMLF